MSEVFTSGDLLAISDKLLPPVRNASRPNAFTVALPRLLARDQRRGPTDRNRPPKSYLFRDPFVNMEDLRFRWGRVWNLDPPASGNTVREDSY
jgi:hypothetical protein